MEANSDWDDQLAELRDRLVEYDAATAAMDFDTGEGFFRWDIARDELIGVLLGDDGCGGAELVVHLLGLNDGGDGGR